jgi:hypothetical protein
VRGARQLGQHLAGRRTAEAIDGVHDLAFALGQFGWCGHSKIRSPVAQYRYRYMLVL